MLYPADGVEAKVIQEKSLQVIRAFSRRQSLLMAAVTGRGESVSNDNYELPAMYLVMLKEPDQALKWFQKLTTNTALCSFFKGIAHSQLNQFGLALQCFDEALKGQTIPASFIFYQKGLVYSKKNNIALAIEFFQKALTPPLRQVFFTLHLHLALREERKKRNVQRREAVILEAKQAEERRIKAEADKKLLEEKTAKANELYPAALEAYHNKDFTTAHRICKKALALNVLKSKQEETVRLCQALSALGNDLLSQVLETLSSVQSITEARQLYEELKRQAGENRRKLPDHQQWHKDLLPSVCHAAVRGAIDGYVPAAELKLEPLPAILRQADMAKEKYPLLY